MVNKLNEIIVLAKLKFDLRDPDEVNLARSELSAILDKEVEPIKTIPALFKYYPFNKLSDQIIHIITRNLYLGEIQGYIAKVKNLDVNKLIKRPAFFKEIYIIFEDFRSKNELKNKLNVFNENFYQIYEVDLSLYNKLYLLRIFPIQTIFEYVTDIKKLPDVAISPKNKTTWDEYFKKKEKGIERGIEDLLTHIRYNHYRAPHLGLGKKHIGDFIDWAGTDLRKPFLHYLHKYKGKGDPRISRALINFLKVEEGGVILDPFVGSGAFIADAPTMGLNAKGVDILKLATLISNVKCNFNVDLIKLRSEVLSLFSKIDIKGLFNTSLNEEKKEIENKIYKYVKGINKIQYLLNNLDDIIHIKYLITEIRDEKIKNFMMVLLSQKILELIEKNLKNNFKNFFRSYVEDRYLILYATLRLAEKLNLKINDGNVEIINADSTHMSFIKDNSIDGILTSPPYFDALDYVENNKIAMIILGFLDDLKIGSPKEYYSKFSYYNLEFPQSSNQLIELLEKAHRFSKAEIVKNYLKMMKLSFRECFRILKPGKYYVMVVSKYHSWVIDGKERKIETSRVLIDLGISEGFEVVDVIQHGLSKIDKGKIDIEDIIIFKKPILEW